ADLRRPEGRVGRFRYPQAPAVAATRVDRGEACARRDPLLAIAAAQPCASCEGRATLDCFMTPAEPIRMSTAVKWTICVVAAIGFLFDIYSVLVGPLILQPALLELGKLERGSPAYVDWAGRLFWI